MVAGQATHTFADARDFHVTNANPTLSVASLLVDVSGPGDFTTSDPLGGNALGPSEGGTVQFDPNVDPGQCVYDFLANFSDGSSREFDGINLCNTSEITVS